jgi:autotransporter-associated beta strand protein
MTVPNGPADIATFGLSNRTDVSISANTEVNAITFTPTNSVYTVTVPDFLILTFSGAGIIGDAQFVTVDGIDGGGAEFLDRSSAGNATIEVGFGGEIIFADGSSAGGASLYNFTSSSTSFLGNSTAGNATIIQMDGLAQLEFRGNSTAGNADIGTGENTSFVSFGETSSADNASIVGDAGVSFFGSSTAGSASIGVFNQSLVFADSSTGGIAQIELGSDPVFGGSGVLDISGHNAPGVTIGSIEGDANSFVFLVANNLTVGSNDIATTFSGVIEDNGFSGSLTKIGKGTLDLKGANTYTGQTNIDGGVLQVDGSISSNTFIKQKGALAGAGTVSGNVTNYGGVVRPGDPSGVPGVLTVSNNYMQTPSAGLTIQIAGADPGQVSVLNVLGNANLNGSLDPELVDGFVPDVGQSFTILGYASVTGSFSHIQNQVFDNGRKRWSLVYQPTGAVLTVIRNGRNQDSRWLAGF